jgi:signal transduction histidine kinase/ligand-binding sensor domain-containing protein/DNA-binding response OmpR family regulator
MQIMKPHWLIFLLAIFVLTFLNAQEREISFDIISVHDGLSDLTVNSITQDYEGYMWFGTNNGLNRYDGIEFTHYYIEGNNPNSLKGNIISCMLEDSRNNLWIGTTGGGLSLYNRDMDNFTNFLHDSRDQGSIRHNDIWSIYEDSMGNLWITTLKGLERFDYETMSFEKHLDELVIPGESVDLRHQAFSSVTEAADGTLWVSILKYGILIYDKDNRKLVRHLRHEPGNPNALSTDEINTLYTDRDGAVWIGTYQGALECVYSKFGNLHFEKFYKGNGPSALSDNRINFIFQDEENLMWIGTGNGLNILDKTSGNITRHYYESGMDNSIASSHMWSGYISSDRLVWIGSHEAGISIYNPWKRRFQAGFEEINNAGSQLQKFIKSIFIDSEDFLWVGTDYGLNKFSPEGRLLETKYHDESEESINVGGVSGIVEDWEKNLWVGTWGGGLHKYNKESGNFRRLGFSSTNLSDHELSDRNIRSMVLDYSGNILIGTTLGYLDIFDPVEEVFRHYLFLDVDSLRGVPVVAISPDKDGTVWLGMAENGGVMHFDPSSNGGTRYFFNGNDPARSLSGNDVQCLLDDGRHMWIGTKNGLNLLDKETGKITTFDEIHGLAGISVLRLEKDLEGNIWMSTPTGISRYEPLTGNIYNYDLKDGALGNCSSSWQDRQGGMYFGGISGLSYFNPSAIRNNPAIPPVVLTGFSIFNKPVVPGSDKSPLSIHINQTEKIKLSHLQTSFSLTFASLNYTLPEKNRFSYMLEGFDQNWINAGTRREAFYTNLKPGLYNFKVQGSNNDGIWNPEPKILTIEVLPAPWKTWWAYSIYFVMVLLLLSAMRMFIISQEKLKSQLVVEKIEHEKKIKISQQNNEIQQFKLKFFTHISHEFRTPLTLILGPLEKIHKNVRDTEIESSVVMIHKNSQRLLRLVNQILDLSKIETGYMKVKVSRGNIVKFVRSVASAFDVKAERKNINYKFVSELEKPVVYFDDDKVEKVVYNLLSNAFKYTPDGGEIEIRLSGRSSEGTEEINTANPRVIEISVIDSGPGIPESEQDKIFDYFYRPAQSRSFVSSGLGLSLVNELVKILKGTLELKENTGNDGSWFLVRIPCEKEMFLPEEIIEDQAAITSGLEDIALVETPIESERVTCSFNPDDPRKRTLPLILIVEDNQELRKFIVNNFTGKYRVIEAEDGNQAYGLMTRSMPDLVITDLMMPHGDGLELNQKIKNDERISHIPVILLTAKTDMESRIAGIQSGADDYILKPFDIEYLICRADNLILNRKKLRESFSKKFNIDPKEFTTNSLDGKFMEKLITLVEENVEDADFGVNQIVDSVAMSRAQLYRKLKSLTNQSVNDFVQQIRLNRAAKYIMEKDKSLAEITYLVGFKDPSYFTKCFRKQFNCLPSEFNDNYHKNIAST